MPNSNDSFTSGITLRSLFIGTVLIIGNAYWLAYAAEMIQPQFLLNFVSLFFNAIFTLFAVIGVNLAWKRLSPRTALTTQELLVIYIMVVMVSTIGGHSMMTFLIGTLAHPFRFATIENEWAHLFWRYIPTWFVPEDAALDAYFKGGLSFYLPKHLRGWMVPILVWTGFVTLVWFTLICLNSIIRVQWTEREKLAYPIVQLPLQMAQGRKSFYKNGTMWIGFSVARGYRNSRRIELPISANPRHPTQFLFYPTSIYGQTVERCRVVTFIHLPFYYRTHVLCAVGHLNVGVVLLSVW